MLRDIDILEDWTAIKKVKIGFQFVPRVLEQHSASFLSLCPFQAKAALSPLKKKVESTYLSADTNKYITVVYLLALL